MTAYRRTTQLARAAVGQDSAFGAIMPPLHLSTNYSFQRIGEPRAYDYSRSANPTRDALGQALADLEGGAGAVITASGMSAVDLALFDVGPGERVIAPHDCYGGSHRLLTERARRGAYQVIFVDQGDHAALNRELEIGAKLVFIETPSNPLMRTVDIADIAARAHAVGAIVVVDNTFLSPALQRPLDLGADRVVHSTTKYINGHSDVVGGAVIAADKADALALTGWANTTGVTGAAFDAYQTLRGLRTLFVRVQEQQVTAAAIAVRLAAHPAVAQVNYPGLVDHPSHAIARRQQGGFGAMLSFRLAGGPAQVQTFGERLKLFSIAESLGGVESLVAHPSSMTHAAMTPEARAAAGITDDLLRLSIGLEDLEDLWADLDQALSATVVSVRRRVTAEA